MRRLCPNIDREDGLETVLEVPIPEEMFTSMGSNVTIRWENMQTWMKAQTNNKWSSSPIIAGRFNELRFLLYLVGSPLIPLQEASTAKYIVQQYTAATGGQPALNSVQSMCVTGHVRIRASDFQQGGGEDECVELKTSREEIGGFVLWQKNPDLWCLELLVPGCKVICGFPLRVRGLGVGIGVAVNRLMNATVSISFISLTKALTIGGAFFLYCGFGLLSLLFIYYCMPETKGKNLEEIEALFSKKKKNVDAEAMQPNPNK
nr:putative polyol transporter 6 [Quercus suber]